MLKMGKKITQIKLFSAHIRNNHQAPFVELYVTVTGEQLSQYTLSKLKNRYPNIESLSHSHLLCTLEILKKFGITAYDAFKQHHVFFMNPITMDNYGEILQECGFIQVLPQHIIKYHTLVRRSTLKQLKNKGFLDPNLKLKEKILKSIKNWPDAESATCNHFDETVTSILKVRMFILERYLQSSLGISTEDFEKYCRLYLPLKHKPMSDIQESIHLAQNEIRLDKEIIKRNGFLLAVDPVNTKLILENVDKLAGLDIRDVVRLVPAILKNNYNNLLKIRRLLEEFGITDETQRKSLRVYCMKPETVRSRLEELKNTKEYQVFSTNPRVLGLVVHKEKVSARVTKIQSANKQAFRLTHLVSSSKAFNDYINGIGRGVLGTDIVLLIHNTLFPTENNSKADSKEAMSKIKLQLKKHKYWTHAAIDVVNDNLRYLKNNFKAADIIQNCQLLLYPVCKVRHHVETHLERKTNRADDVNPPLDYTLITKSQILSLVLYEIELKHHFTGDGMWVKDETYTYRQESMSCS